MTKSYISGLNFEAIFPPKAATCNNHHQAKHSLFFIANQKESELTMTTKNTA